MTDTEKLQLIKKIVENCLEFDGDKGTAFHDGELLCGELHKSGDPAFKNDPNLYLTRNYYFVTLPGTLKCISYLFRSSHVRKVKKIQNSRHYCYEDIKLEA